MLKFAPVLLLVLVGCSMPEQETVQRDVQKRLETTKNDAIKGATGLAQSAWVSAQQQASKLTADSSNRALQEAKNALVNVQNELANVKMPQEVDTMRSAYVEEQIARLEAAMDLKTVGAKMDEAVKRAKELPANAEKTDREIKSRLAAADKQFKQLQAQYNEANHNLQAAETTIDGIRDQIKQLGGALP